MDHPLSMTWCLALHLQQDQSQPIYERRIHQQRIPFALKGVVYSTKCIRSRYKGTVISTDSETKISVSPPLAPSATLNASGA